MSAAAQTMSPADAKSRVTAVREKEKEKEKENEKEKGKETENQYDEARWRPVLGLPCQLTVELPLPNFTVADFLGLRPGSVLATNWRLARDVPLRINGTLIAWAEFEGAGNRMAVRLTDLA